MKRIFFDNAATTPISEEVIEVMTDALRNNFGNPSSIHAEGRIARAAIEKARKTVANHIGASIGEVFFTSCGTESNNMILKNAVRDLGVKRIISSPIEHHCVLHSLDAIGAMGEVEIVFVNIDKKGCPDYSHLNELLADQNKKTLVSLMHGNNEIGTLLDLDRVSELCQEHNTLFHSDTVQTMGFYPINIAETNISFLSGSAHKFHGPKGVGFVYINGDNHIKPYLDGGAQERNMRGGTENIYGIVGLAKALDLAYVNIDARREHITNLRNYMRRCLEDTFEGVQFNGDVDGSSHYKLLSVSFPPSEKSDLLLLSLDIAGVSVSGGSACSSGADAGSHVITALNGDPDRKTIRFSFSHYNTIEEVDLVVEKLKEILPVREKV